MKLKLLLSRWGFWTNLEKLFVWFSCSCRWLTSLPSPLKLLKNKKINQNYFLIPYMQLNSFGQQISGHMTLGTPSKKHVKLCEVRAVSQIWCVVFLGEDNLSEKRMLFNQIFWWRPFPYNYFNFHLSKENTGFSFKLLKLLWKNFRDVRVLKISENQAVSHVYIINFFFRSCISKNQAVSEFKLLQFSYM